MAIIFAEIRATAFPFFYFPPHCRPAKKEKCQRQVVLAVVVAVHFNHTADRFTRALKLLLDETKGASVGAREKYSAQLSKVQVWFE